jgi:hypothetical protein
MVKERTRKISAVNDEICQILASKVTWDGTIDHIEVFRNNVESYYEQIGTVYIFDESFQEAYLENYLYFGQRLGMMMKSRSVTLYRMLEILIWLIQFLKN